MCVCVRKRERERERCRGRESEKEVSMQTHKLRGILWEREKPRPDNRWTC